MILTNEIKNGFYNNLTIAFSGYNIKWVAVGAIESFLYNYPQLRNNIVYFDDESTDGTKEELESRKIKVISWKYKKSEYEKLVNKFNNENISVRINAMMQDIALQTNTKYLLLCDGDTFFSASNSIDSFISDILEGNKFVGFKGNHKLDVNDPIFNELKKEQNSYYLDIIKNSEEKNQKFNIPKCSFFYSMVDLEYLKSANLLFDDLNEEIYSVWYLCETGTNWFTKLKNKKVQIKFIEEGKETNFIHFGLWSSLNRCPGYKGIRHIDEDFIIEDINENEDYLTVLKAINLKGDYYTKQAIKTNLNSILRDSGYVNIKVEDCNRFSFVCEDNNALFSFIDLLDRLNSYYGKRWHYALNNHLLTITIKEDIVSNYSILKNALLKKEHFYYPANNSQKLYDIKLGYSCNNNCMHCVIKPNIRKIQKDHPSRIQLESGYGMWCREDLDYHSVISQIKSLDWSKYNSITLTGGEPTIRKDLVEILKFLYYNLPHIEIGIQTNGRNLSNIALVKNIRRYSRKIDFVIAIHGPEKTHNKIVNNRKEKGNPFAETIAGIKNLQKEFGNQLKIRTETVISSKNQNELFELLRYIYEDLKIDHMGFSYPHLKGFSEEEIINIAPSLNNIISFLKELNDYKHINKIKIGIEAVPQCILSRYVKSYCVDNWDENKQEATVNYIGRQKDNHLVSFLKERKKKEECMICIYNESCPGVWYETFDLNEKYITPMTKKEAEKCIV